MEKKPDFKAMSTRTKLGYIWDYYKWHIAAAVAGTYFAVSLIHHFVSYQEPVLSAVMINCSSPDVDESGFHEFLTACGRDPEKEPVSLTANLYFTEDTNMDAFSNLELLTAIIAAGDQDLFFGTGDIYLSFAEQGALADLSAILPADILEQYGDSLVYTTEDGTVEAYPCAVELADNRWLSGYGYYDSCYFGIFYNAPHSDVARQFAEFLLNN